MKKIAFIILSSSSLWAQSPLDNHHWKHRLILIFSNSDYSKTIQKNQAAINERDIVYYHFQGNNLRTNGKKLTEQQQREVAKAYQHRGNVILIGKDGGIKDTSETLDLQKIFTLIDGMPMRKQEMNPR